MIDTDDVKPGKTGLYERAVEWVTEKLEEYLHRKTARFVKKSVNKYAPNDPKYAEMIEFEVRRRGDGPGLTQDVAEPLVWTGIKTSFALLVAVVAKTFEKKEAGKKWPTRIKWIGLGSALALVANQTIELFRLVPRYTAGLQGSLRMAIERQKSIEAGQGDPFSKQQERAIYKPGDPLPESEQPRPANTQSIQVVNRMGPPAMPGPLDAANASQAVPQQAPVRAPAQS